MVNSFFFATAMLRQDFPFRSNQTKDNAAKPRKDFKTVITKHIKSPNVQMSITKTEARSIFLIFSHPNAHCNSLVNG